MSESKAREIEAAGYGTSQDFLEVIERQEYRAFDEESCTNEHYCRQCIWAEEVEMKQRTLVADRARNLAALQSERRTGLDAAPPWERNANN